MVVFCHRPSGYQLSTTARASREYSPWPLSHKRARERFNHHGIRYGLAAKPKSDLYRDLLPAINSRKVDLLEDARLVVQIVGLERRTARGGKVRILGYSQT